MIKMILATGRNGELGDSKRPDGLPWDNNPEDMRYFRETTKDSIVVYGGNTFRQLQKMGYTEGLPYRHNVIITRDMFGLPERICPIRVWAIPNFFKLLQEEVWIIGGKSIYEQCLPYVDEVHISLIDKDFPEADTHMDLDFLKEFEFSDLIRLNDHTKVHIFKRNKE